MKIYVFKILPLALLLIGCHSNPYPDEGGEIVNGRLPARRDTSPAYTIDIDSTLKFREGVTGSHSIKFYVPRGVPQVSFKGLPDGFIFNKKEGTLKWIPGFDDANDSQNPMVKVVHIPIEIWLRSSSDVNTAVKKDIVLEVIDSPRDFKVVSRVLSEIINEGDSLEKEFRFINEDFPNGPFSISSKNLPHNIKLSINSNTVKLQYTSVFGDVGVEDTCTYYSCKKEYRNGLIELIAPDGRKLKVNYALTVKDIRKKVRFLNPDKITQGTDVSFIVSAIDPNFEINPVVTLVNRPRSGKVEFERIETMVNELKQTHMRFSWRDIPENMRGTTTRIGFRGCVYDYRKNKNKCDNKTIEVAIEEQTHSIPKINRLMWPLAQIKYLKFNKNYEINIPVVDGDSEQISVASVIITPQEMQKYVTFRNGTLFIRSIKEGMAQFNVTARSIYGLETTESFTLETLPINWSTNLNLVGSKRSNEVLKNKKLIDSLDIANPDFQDLNVRLLSARETLVLGTDILHNSEKISEVSNINIKNIIIMSPALKLIKGPLAKEIRKLGIGYAGRFNKVVRRSLKDYYFLIGKGIDLKYPQRRVRLSGTLTSESFNPLILRKKINSKCIRVLSLGSDLSGFDHLVSVKCARQNGGYIIINSFEFGDMQLSAADSDISKMWLNTIMEK